MATQPGSGRPSGQAPTGARIADEPGYHTVRRGETLLRIAQDYNQNYHDLVTWNNLSNPNDIRVDQVLRVLPPVGGAQTGSIGAGSGSGVDVRPLNGATVAPPAVPSAAANTTKTGPRGDKRPYSESALAEMQKRDSANATTFTAPSTISPAHTEAPQTGDSPPDATAAGEEAPAFIWPTEGKVVSNFDSGKKGIDIAGKSGQAVVAAAAGKVMYAGSGIRGYGNLVIVKHTNNLLSAYAHNKSITVKEGQNVSKGEKIAEMGNSDSDAVKLHFEIRHQGKPVDPAKYLPAK